MAAARSTLAALLVAAACAGCATVPAGGGAEKGGAQGPAPAASPVDPWENWNRKVFAFNEAVDKAVLEPVARAWRDHVPKFVRTSVSNVLGNIYDVWSTANHLLQGKLQTGLEMGMRVVTNTVFGAAGVMDPATEMGLVRRSEDFGQTLGRWGVGSGPYVVLPLLGPSSVRDTMGTVADRMVAPSALPESDTARFGVAGVEVVNTRSQLLDAGSLVDQVALDKYVFIRDGYLARRRDAVYDGAAPMERFDDDFEDEPAAAPPPTLAHPAAVSASAPAAGASAPSAARPASAPVGTPPAAAPGAAPAASAPR